MREDTVSGVSFAESPEGTGTTAVLPTSAEVGLGVPVLPVSS